MLCEAGSSSSSSRLKLYALASLASLVECVEGRMMCSLLREQARRICDATQGIEVSQGFANNSKISKLKSIINAGYWG